MPEEQKFTYPNFPPNLDFKEPHFTRYIKFIESRSLREIPEGTYTEKHHIVPKSLGGSNEEENLIILTAREHFIAHIILWKGIGKNMTFAIHRLKTSKYYPNKLTSSQYGKLREDYANYKSKIQKGFCNAFLSDGTKVYVSTDDSRWKTGELHGNRKGFLRVRDKEGNIFHVHNQDLRYLNGDVVSVFKDTVVVQIDGEFKRISKDSEEYKNLDIIITPNKGKTISEETKLKISNSFKKTWANKSQEEKKEWNRKNSESNKGKKLTKETKEKISKSKKGKGWNDEERRKKYSENMKGEKNHFYGKTHDKETRYKIGANRGKIFVHKNGVNKSIFPEEMDDYLNNGWVKGQKTNKNKGKLWINKNGESIMVNESCVDSFLRDGWSRGRKKDYVRSIHKTNQDGKIISKKVNINEIVEWINKGWAEGTGKHNNKVWISNNGGDKKSIFESELSTYIENGWKKGIPTKNKTVWVHKGENERLVPEMNVDYYLNNGWIKGRVGRKKFMYKLVDGSAIERRISVEEIDDYIKEGWVLGKHNSHNKNRIWVSKIDKNNYVIDRKMIYEEDLDLFLKQGYKRGQNKN